MSEAKTPAPSVALAMRARVKLGRLNAGVWSSLRRSRLRLLGADIAPTARVGRIAVNWPNQLRVGDGSTLYDGVRVVYCHGEPRPGPSLVIGSRTVVTADVLFNLRDRIEIGDDCLLATCSFFDSNHGVEAGRHIKDQLSFAKPIVIGNDVWVGYGSVILAGVTVGDGAVIAAGAVVTKSIPAGEVWGGVPAKRIGVRPTNE